MWHNTVGCGMTHRNVCARQASKRGKKFRGKSEHRHSVPHTRPPPGPVVSSLQSLFSGLGQGLAEPLGALITEHLICGLLTFRGLQNWLVH